MYDIVIIGAGVSGSACARELARLKLNICVVEKEEDVCCGTSKANSAICHAGFDPTPGSLMAELNLKGNRMMKAVSEELDFPFIQNGSLVICLKEEDRPALQALYERGLANGVPDMRIVEQHELRQMEPNISQDAVAALYAPTAGIICPFTMNIAYAENAYMNGVEFRFNTKVTGFEKKGGYEAEDEPWIVLTDQGPIETKYVINAAGVYSGDIHNMVAWDTIDITPRRGQYFLLDRTVGDFVSHTIFQLPDPLLGKGVLISPTAHGNILVGPTACDIGDKEGTQTTADGLDYLRRCAGATVERPPLHMAITSFSGLRAHENQHEFVIGEVRGAPNFIDCAGIESPGLTAAPAIGCYVADIMQKLTGAEPNPDFNGKRTGILDPKKLSKEEKIELIKKQPAYANVICRCETVTEGEILDAIHRPLGAKSLDGVKRRTRAGMGRCQSGFCSPKVMEILARELGCELSDITKTGKGSKIIVGINKDRII